MNHQDITQISFYENPLFYIYYQHNDLIISIVVIPWIFYFLFLKYASERRRKIVGIIITAASIFMALGALLLQKKTKLVDVALVQEIMENPYMQFFIGLPGYTEKQPFVPSLMVEFRKRLNEEILGEINEMIIAYNEDHDDDNDNQDPTVTDDEKETHENAGTLILDATYAPYNGPKN